MSDRLNVVHDTYCLETYSLLKLLNLLSFFYLPNKSKFGVTNLLSLGETHVGVLCLSRYPSRSSGFEDGKYEKIVIFFMVMNRSWVGV